MAAPNQSPTSGMHHNFFSPGLRIFFWWPALFGGLFGLFGGSAWMMVGVGVGVCIVMLVAALLLLNLF